MKKLFYGLGAVAAVVTPVVAVVSCGSSSEEAKATLHYQDSNKVATFEITNGNFTKVLTAGGLVSTDFKEDGSIADDATLGADAAAKKAVITEVAANTGSIQEKLQTVLAHEVAGATVSIGLWPHGELELIVTGINKADLKAKLVAAMDDATVTSSNQKALALWNEIKTLVKAAL